MVEEIVIFEEEESYLKLCPVKDEYGKWYCRLKYTHSAMDLDVYSSLSVDEFDKLIEALIKLRMLHNAPDSLTNI